MTVVQTCALPIYVDRKDIDYAVTINDITTRKLQERELVLKSVAFKEMHHRIKNNLQTIAALLRLQRNSIDSEEGKQAMNDTISRILAISSTHEILVEIALFIKSKYYPLFIAMGYTIFGAAAVHCLFDIVRRLDANDIGGIEDRRQIGRASCRERV